MKKPKLCEILNVEINEKFNIDNGIYVSNFNCWVNEYGRLLTDSPYNKSPYSKFNYIDSEVVKIINGDYKIVKGV